MAGTPQSRFRRRAIRWRRVSSIWPEPESTARGNSFADSQVHGRQFLQFPSACRFILGGGHCSYSPWGFPMTEILTRIPFVTCRSCA